MAVGSPFLTGVLSGFAPAMGILYLMLHRYEGFFDERKVFRALMFGMAAGALVTLAELFLFAPATLSPNAALTTVVIGYPALETALTTAVMNRQQYRGKKDTPYYAAAFGLGLGAVSALLLASIVDLSRERLDQSAGFLFYAVLVQLTVGSVLIRGAMAVSVGRATAEGLPFSGLIKGLMWLVPFTVLVGLAYFVAPLREGSASIFFPTAALAYALFAARYAQRRVLDEIVPDELAQHVRREMRKQMRPGGEEEPPRT